VFKFRLGVIIGVLVISLASTVSAGFCQLEDYNRYIDKGMSHVAEGEYQQAIDEFTNGIDSHPSYGPAYLYRAEVYEKIGRWRDALADYAYYIQYASVDTNNADVAKAKERVKLITWELPILECWLKELVNNENSDQVSRVSEKDRQSAAEWVLDGNVVKVRHNTSYSSNQEVKLAVSKVEQYGKYKKNVINEDEVTGKLSNGPSEVHTVATEIGPLAAGDYFFELWLGDYRKSLFCRLIAIQHLKVGVMSEENFTPLGDLTAWQSLNNVEKNAPQMIVKEPARLKSAWAKELDEGFLGYPWGTRAKTFPGIRHLVDIPPNLMVYSANLDLAPILGSVSAYSSPRLVFAKDGGLVKAHIDFDAKDYDRVHARLTKLLGEPSPIIYELQAVRMDFIQRSEWFVGEKTKLVLTWKASGATIEISKRNFMMPESPSLEDIIGADQWKRAQEYEQQKRILEASSLYQELLNGTGSYCDFTPEGQERLAKYSMLNEATVYLSEHRDLVFYGLKNIFTDSAGQQWVRINLGPEARKELQQQRTDVVEEDDKLSNIGAVLCRVKVIPASGKCLVVEQVWLDDSNRIIGDRPAWTPQDSGWPVPYIKQACEDFLEAWFTAGNTAVQVIKEEK